MLLAACFTCSIIIQSGGTRIHYFRMGRCSFEIRGTEVERYVSFDPHGDGGLERRPQCLPLVSYAADGTFIARS